ncbi:MAG: hypothetical protein COA83_09350 [Methylophaga sp.]|nr:MAG: hypothetical protein COA83_09350 [Methylophaga sp.]
MSIIDDLKEKAVGYAEDVGKKKDVVVKKAAHLKKEYDENQRERMEHWVYKKEAELKELEKTLKKREKAIKQKELKLKQKFFLRFVLVAAGLSIIGLFSLASITSRTNNQEHVSIPLSSNSGTRELTSKTTEPYTSKESVVYSTYGDIDADNPKFDVGKYCLDKEKISNITFEECLAVAAAKIMSRK